MPAGRPSSYDPEIASQICHLIACNTRLRQIEQMDGMPSRPTIRLWLAQNPEFLTQYDKAREEMVEQMFDELLEIADDSRNDFAEAEDGGLKPQPEMVARARLRADTRKWLMSKVLPRKYGERVALTGSDGGPVELSLTVAVSQLTAAFGEVIENEAQPETVRLAFDESEK